VPKPIFKNLLAVTTYGLLALSSPVLSAEAVLTTKACAPSALSQDRVRALINEEAKRQDADATLALAIAEHESTFGARTNSPMGARGIMQLMPATADRYGVKDICDDEENVRAGIAYLNDLSRLFHGQIMLIAAAYNAGENRVISAGGIPSIAETANYAALVTNTYFGFDRVIGDAERRAHQSKDKSRHQSSQVIMSAGSDASSPVPINTPSEPAATNTWLGGSVLYVQQ
jgi:soluble lytic murein transglycosylase-like protein